MMEIPGFRNALLSGMSRRIREADDRLAAYARRITRHRVAELSRVLRAGSPTAKRREALGRRSLRRLDLELGQARRANENDGALAPTAEIRAAASSRSPTTSLATMALTPLCATGALNAPVGRRAFEVAASLTPLFLRNLTGVWGAAV